MLWLKGVGEFLLFITEDLDRGKGNTLSNN